MDSSGDIAMLRKVLWVLSVLVFRSVCWILVKIQTRNWTQRLNYPVPSQMNYVSLKGEYEIVCLDYVSGNNVTFHRQKVTLLALKTVSTWLGVWDFQLQGETFLLRCSVAV